MNKFEQSLFLHKMQCVSPIGPGAVAALVACVEPCSFAKRDTILRPGVRCRYAWFVERGCVRHFWMVDGAEVTTSFSVEGNVVFGMDELYYDAVCTECAQAIEPVEAFCITLKDFNRLLRENLDICNWGRIIHQNEYRRLHQSHRELLAAPARERYELFRHQFPDVCRRANLGHIASYLGITPATLSRIRAHGNG